MLRSLEELKFIKGMTHGLEIEPCPQGNVIEPMGHTEPCQAARGVNRQSLPRTPDLIRGAGQALFGVGCGKGRNDTLRRSQRLFGHLYSPVSRMWPHPRGEVCGRSSGTTGRPACLRLATASPSRAMFQ